MEASVGDTLTCKVVRAMAVVRNMIDQRKYAENMLREAKLDEYVLAVARRETIQITVSPGIIVIIYVVARHNGSTLRADLKKRLHALQDTRRVLLVFRDPPLNMDAVSVKLREEFQNVRVEMFCLDELQYDVTEHALVPPHFRISDQEQIRHVLRQYGVKRTQLPLIQKTDPVCRYLAVESGDLVKIHRKSPAGGVHVVYRLCV